MIFTGAILLLERDEGLLENLFITPLSVRSYMLAKALALSLPAMGSTLLISLALAPFGWSILMILPAVALTTLFFSIFTFIPASAAKDIMDLIGKIAIYGSIFGLTILDYFGVLKGWYQFLLPSKGALVLTTMAAGGGTPAALEIILAFASLTAGILIILPRAEKSFHKNLILKGAAVLP
jgi:fluoroquinolone transport system permease protein